jgi:hypothetical protein
MRIGRFLIFVVALVGVVLVGASRADADVVTYSESLEGAGGEGSVFSFSLPQFDPKLGTLTDASYRVTDHIIFQMLAIDAEGNPATVGFFTFSSGLVLNGPGLTFKDTSLTENLDIIFDCVGLSLSDFDECRFQTGSFTRIPDLGLSPLIGTGSLPLTVSQAEDDFCFAQSSPGVEAPCIPNSVNLPLTVAVTYDYQKAVPEPFSGLLLLTGIPLSALAHRRAQSALKKYPHP